MHEYRSAECRCASDPTQKYFPIKFRRSSNIPLPFSKFPPCEVTPLISPQPLDYCMIMPSHRLVDTKARQVKAEPPVPKPKQPEPKQETPEVKMAPEPRPEEGAKSSSDSIFVKILSLAAVPGADDGEAQISEMPITSLQFTSYVQRLVAGILRAGANMNGAGRVRRRSGLRPHCRTSGRSCRRR